MSSLLVRMPARDGFNARLHARGKQYQVWIGPLTRRQEREYNQHLSAVLDAFKVGASVDPGNLEFFDTIPARIREKFESWGMIPPTRKRQVTAAQQTIGGWTQLFIDEQVGGSNPRTKENYRQARLWLLKSIPESKNLASVTVGDLQRFQKAIKVLALSTRNKHVQRVRTMLQGAVDDGLIESSPAAKLKQELVTKIDRSKQYFVTPDESKRVLDSLPSTYWKLIFALMRFQGFRRHEVFAIQWTHVDWVEETITVPPATKTGQRTMPIFPEVLPLLRDAQELSKSEKVVHWTHTTEESVTTLLRKRVEKVLGKCWPKPCHQLRSTRRTELEKLFPSHVVNEWLGHDSETAENHYLQITADDLAKAKGVQTLVRIQAGIQESHRTAENCPQPNAGKRRKNVDRSEERHPRQESNGTEDLPKNASINHDEFESGIQAGIQVWEIDSLLVAAKVLASHGYRELSLQLVQITTDALAEQQVAEAVG